MVKNKYNALQLLKFHLVLHPEIRSGCYGNWTFSMSWTVLLFQN